MVIPPKINPKPPPLPQALPGTIHTRREESECVNRSKRIVFIAIAIGIAVALVFSRWPTIKSARIAEASPTGNSKVNANRLSVDNDVDDGSAHSRRSADSQSASLESKESQPNSNEFPPPHVASSDNEDDPRMDEDPSAEESFPIILRIYDNKNLTAKTLRAGVDGAGIKSGEAGGKNPFIEEGIGATSTVFVVDVSGSMQTADRLPRVLASLVHAIEMLNTQQEFSVVFFDSSAYAFPVPWQLLKANSKNKEEALRWIKSTHGGSGTEPMQAMKIAIQLNPERIVLLSDGEFDPYCVQLIQKNNQRQKHPARIDCVGLVEEVETLKQIANQNQGIYYQAH